MGEIWSAISWLISSKIEDVAINSRDKINDRRSARELQKQTDQIENQHGSTNDLENRAKTLVEQAAFPGYEDFIEGVQERYMEACGGLIATKDIRILLYTAICELYAKENLTEPPAKRVLSGAIEAGRYRDELLAHARKLEDPGRTLNILARTFTDAAVAITERLPSFARGQDLQSTTSIPIVDGIAEPKTAIQEMVLPFFAEDVRELGLFKDLRAQLDRNQKAQKELPADDERPATEVVRAYLANTDLEQIFEARVPFRVTLAHQLEHSMIAAGTRYGKSQLMGAIIAEHIQSNDPPGVIVVDSSGDFLEKISRLEVFSPNSGRLADRLLILNPTDSPQLNMFDISALREKGYKEDDLEQVEADIINMFNYVFASIGSELTTQQGTGFNFLVRLLLSMQGSTIETFHHILELPAKKYDDVPEDIREAIEKLDATSVSYFKNQFFTVNMLATRNGVAQRLYRVVQVPFFRRMFSGANRVDFFQAMNEGKIIVVNTAKSLLQADASALFGRYIIARVMSGAFERTVIPDMNKRRPCILFVDEAQEYFDASIDTLLTQIGKFKLGLCIAFQYFGQLDDKLRSSVLGNTTVKYAGGLNAAESRLIARELRVSDAFVMAQKKDTRDPERPEWAEFAVHVKYAMDQAVSLSVPFYQLENLPRMTDAEHRVLLERNRTAVAAREPTASPSHSGPSEDQQTPHHVPPELVAAAHEPEMPNGPEERSKETW